MTENDSNPTPVSIVMGSEPVAWTSALELRRMKNGNYGRIQSEIGGDFTMPLFQPADQVAGFTPIQIRNLALAKELVKGNGFNHPDPKDDEMRLVGFRVPAEVAGLSPALFALGAIRTAVIAAVSEGAVAWRYRSGLNDGPWLVTSDPRLAGVERRMGNTVEALCPLSTPTPAARAQD